MSAGHLALQQSSLQVVAAWHEESGALRALWMGRQVSLLCQLGVPSDCTSAASGLILILAYSFENSSAEKAAMQVICSSPCSFEEHHVVGLLPLQPW